MTSNKNNSKNTRHDLNAVKLRNCSKTPPQISFSSFLLMRFEKLIVVQFAILIQVVLLDCLNLSVFNSYHLIDKLFSGNNSELIFDKKQTHPMNPGFYVRLTKSTSFIESFFFASFNSPWKDIKWRNNVAAGFAKLVLTPNFVLTIRADTHPPKKWSKATPMSPSWCNHPCSCPSLGNKTHCKRSISLFLEMKNSLSRQCLWMSR